MYIESEDYRNLWILAHEWAGYNHEKTEANNLPKQVELNIKRLSAAIMRRALKAQTKNLVIFYDDSITEFLLNFNHVVRLIKCRSGKAINKAYLETLFVRRPDFLDWCEKEKLPNSDFWVLTQVVENYKINNRPKNELEDKAVCRAVASVYWRIDPNIHPSHMASSKAITHFGNGRLYKGNTVTEWISNLDPLAKERKPGRPKDVQYKIDLETGALSETVEVKQ